MLYFILAELRIKALTQNKMDLEKIDVKVELQKQLEIESLIPEIQKEIDSSDLDWILRSSCGELRKRGDVIYVTLDFLLLGHERELDY
jgi:hypothetical protein